MQVYKINPISHAITLFNKLDMKKSITSFAKVIRSQES